MLLPRRGFRRAVSRAVSVVVIILVIVIIAVAFLALAGNVGSTISSQTTPSSSSLTSSSSPSTTIVQQPIIIGMTMPLSGSLDADGRMSLDGLKLWAQNVNASGGIYVKSMNAKMPVRLIYYDDASTTSNVASLYPTLVSQGAKFLVAPYSSGLTLAAAPIAEQNHLLLLSHGGASDSIWAKNYNYVVGVLSPGSKYMIPVIDMLGTLNPKPTNVAMFFGNDAFSLSVMKAAGPYAVSKGFTIAYNQTYDESASSYTSQLSQIQASGATVIIGGAHFADGETIMKGIQSLGLHFGLVSLLVAPDDPHFIQDLGTVANGVAVPSQWEANQEFTSFSPYYGNITSKQFNSTFTSTFGMVPNYEAAEGYNTGLVLEKGISDSGSLNSTVVRNQLSSENFWTFYGNFQIGASGIQTGHSMVVAQWQNGTKQTIWPTAVASAKPVFPAP
jgi:branched-chain amino acid transport system substrate-binding protein